MLRTRRFLAATMASAAALVTAACSSTSADTSTGPVGDPVYGGTARIVMMNEPRTLDPAAMSNAWPFAPVLANGLYGTLMINDVRTGEIKYKMAESFATEDNGKTFTLTLREGLKFSDGSALTAQDVKFNWDRIRNPETGSTSLRYAVQIASTEVVDPLTMKVTLRSPIPNYVQNVVSGALNWIASPEALKKGQTAFNANPIGAGPYILKSWSRQDKIVVVKNSRYWDAPKPYLDRLILRATDDTMQRLSTLISGGADVAVDTSWKTIAKAREAGFSAQVVPLNGGQSLTMNSRRPPFNDIRARKAISMAVDLDAMNLSLYNGEGEIPSRLFKKSSPFYSDVQLRKRDAEKAQKLFDQLAAEGKPVSFTFTSQDSSESRIVAESLQAQLGAFENVEVDIRIIATAETSAVYASKEFDMVISSTMMIDPEPGLWAVFHGKSRSNMTGINDPQINAALVKGRHSTSPEERRAAYKVVQERLAALTPLIYYTRPAPTVETAPHIHGAQQYGSGSLLPEELWMEQ